MAARKKRTALDEAWRSRIQTSMLVNRLSDNASGKLKQELTAGQIKSIEILLRKTAPDLQAITISGDDENPVKVIHEAGKTLDAKLERFVAGRPSRTEE